MNNCEEVKSLLVLYAEGELKPDENRSIRDHLAVCADCRDEVAKVDSIRSWLRDPELFMPEQYSWQLLPRTLADRARKLSPAKSWVPSNLGPLGWTASLAASLLLACGLVWMLNRYVPAPPADTRATGHGNEAFLRQIQSVYAREATARYLNECQDLLINVVRAEKNCEGEKYDVSSEVARARELLRRKRMLDVELRAPEIARAKKLCDELENFLVNLSTSETCESSDGLHAIERFIEREQLLLRINLLQAELS